MPPVSVLIKPASGKCNLRCDYCFYSDIAVHRNTADLGFMDQAILEAIVRKVLEFADEFATFSFQGGEPTLCGLDFYRTLIQLQRVHNIKNVEIKNCIQTNGILLDESWAEFLHDNSFLVGLSLDGPAEIHDMFRKDARGVGTYQTVMQKARLLEKYQVEYNILFVVTGAHAEKPGKLYSFFQKNNLNYLQFIPCLDPSAEHRGTRRFSLHPAAYTSFLIKFFDRWSDEILAGKLVSIRYFENLVLMIMGKEPETCSMRGVCSCQFVFEADGSCYPCDFYVTDTWRLGNIQDMGILDFYRAETARNFIDISTRTAEECKQCKWRALCRGGCRRDRPEAPEGNLLKNYYCRSYAAFLEHAYPKLTQIAQMFSNKT